MLTSDAHDLHGINFEEGYIAVVDKPLRWTSADVVRKVKFTLRKLGYRRIKVGHAGTLDPLATGILLVCIGRATKMADALQAEEKEYVADVMLGATTPSYDLEHEIDATYPWEHITCEAVEEALRSLTGERLQEPPVYSAKKIEGTRAYELAARARRSSCARPGSRSTRWSCSNATCPGSGSACGAAREPTSVRWPARSARRSTAAPTSPRCAGPAAAVSRWPMPGIWRIFSKICKILKQNSFFCV